MATTTVDVAAEYRALVDGVRPARSDGTSYRFLVASTDFEHPRGDLFVAAGLARALVARGHGARLLPPEEWYDQQETGSVVVAMIADTDVRRIPRGPVTVGWIRNRTDDWIARPGLGLYDALFASSELSRRAVAEVFDGPTGVCRIGVDPDVFSDDGRERTVVAATTANHWGSDRAVHRAVRTLANDGFSVDWYGVDRSGDRALASVNKGVVGFFDVPDVYRHARLTVDDLQDVALGYGNLNSRIFEALACGSLPVTNGGLGLAEAGLDGVPVYRTVQELDAIAAAVSGGEFDALTKDLSQRVLKEHTYAVRAETFEALTGEAIEAHAARRARPVVNFFPDYSSTNPYQTMLYSAAREAGVVAPVADIFNRQVARDPRDGSSLDGQTLHLHWLNGIVQPGANIQEAFYRLDRFKQEILELKERGVRIVWTVHNVLAHELTYRFLEIDLSEFLAQQADVIHVMSRDTVKDAADLYPLPEHKVVQVEHPSFDGCYPTFLDRDSARSRLTLHDDDRSFLFFGGIRHYKGIPRLLDAFEIASQHDARLRLDVVGGLARTMNARIVDRMKAAERVVPHIGFVPDDHVQRYLCAADVMVLPYENILNSGSLLLATTFGIPVIAPRLGQLAELDGADFVEFFEAGSTESLAEALERAADTLVRPEARAAARAYAAERRPGPVAEAFSRDVLGWGR